MTTVDYQTIFVGLNGIIWNVLKQPKNWAETGKHITENWLAHPPPTA